MVILRDLVAVWDTDGAWAAPALSLGVSVGAVVPGSHGPHSSALQQAGLHPAAEPLGFQPGLRCSTRLGKVWGCWGWGLPVLVQGTGLSHTAGPSSPAPALPAKEGAAPIQSNPIKSNPSLVQKIFSFP